MSIDELKTAIARLSNDELWELSTWLDDHLVDVSNAEIDNDSETARLDALQNER